MTYADYLCRLALLRLVYNWAQHGGRYVQLPPARYYHGHVNEHRKAYRVGSHVVEDKAYSTTPRFTVARRKWMLDQLVEPPQQPTPLRMPALPYHYRTLASSSRRAKAIAILKHMHENGGDLCGVEARITERAPSVAGHYKCDCILIGQHQAHRCEHGFEW